MKRNKQVKDLAISGLLTALGILIPMMMPLKLILGPSTYTLASHVPVFIAMFISPKVAVMVALGTTLGFYTSLGPIVAARAFSHLAFAIPGSLYLQKHKLETVKSKFMFNGAIALIHGTAEFLTVALITSNTLNQTILLEYFIFLGIGTIIHSIVDFVLASSVADALNLQT